MYTIVLHHLYLCNKSLLWKNNTFLLQFVIKNKQFVFSFNNIKRTKFGISLSLISVIDINCFETKWSENMPPKKQRRKIKGAEDERRQTQTETKSVSIQCLFITPGPAYKLKTLVGYKDHCVSRYRNPAYTFGRRGADVFGIAEGPGPKYMVREPKRVGFTFGIPTKHHDLDTGPGPKYKLPNVPRGPFFSIKWRTKVRKIHETPGPYNVKPIADAPAFFMGLRTAGPKPPDTPGPYTFKMNAIRPRVPMYTMIARRTLRVTSASPGPIYALPPIKPTPAFSFGVKHSVCALPYIVECDDQC